VLKTAISRKKAAITAIHFQHLPIIMHVTSVIDFGSQPLNTGGGEETFAQYAEERKKFAAAVNRYLREPTNNGQIINN
jgi:hypothetical protein